MSTMSVRSAAAGTATAALVVGVLGSPALVDAGQDLAERHRSSLTAETLTGLPNWDVFDRGTPTDVVWGIVLKLGVFLVVVALLAGLAGRASRRSAFLGGWASVVVAAGIAGAVHYVYEDAVVGARQNPFQVSYFDNLLGAVNTGAGFGLWTGWLVGLAVAATARLPVRSPRIPTLPATRSRATAPRAMPTSSRRSPRPWPASRRTRTPPGRSRWRQWTRPPSTPPWSDQWRRIPRRRIPPNRRGSSGAPDARRCRRWCPPARSTARCRAPGVHGAPAP